MKEIITIVISLITAKDN